MCQSCWNIVSNVFVTKVSIYFQQSPRLLSPGSGNVSARYVGWNSTGMANGGTGGFTNSSQIPGVGGGRFNKCEDTDSGTGSSSEAHVIRHIDRNILACQICQQRYKEPKVRIILQILSLSRIYNWFRFTFFLE